MPFPNFSGKHAQDPLVTPARFVEFMRARGIYGAGGVPESIIVTFQESLIRGLRTSGRIDYEASPTGRIYPMKDAPVGVVLVGIGAPALGVRVEELTELGAKRFVIVGTAGSLQRNVHVGDAVLCTGAIRDEGVSYHYMPDGEDAVASEGLVSSLRKELQSCGLTVHEGRSWTIDAPYRETIEEARHYRDDGVLTVEMEASALFAVAAYRNVEAGALFAISDLLGELDWAPRFDSDETRIAQERLFNVAVAALRSGVEAG